MQGEQEKEHILKKNQPNGGENRNFMTGKRRTGYMDQNCQNQQTFH